MAKRIVFFLISSILCGCGGSGSTPSASTASTSTASTSTVITQPAKIAFWGDSMVWGPYVQILSGLTGLDVFNGGVGGQTSTSVAIRQGGIGLTISIAGDIIPSTGNVNVTAKSGTPATSTGGSPLYGWLSGVYGYISRLDNPDANINDYIFTRSTSGTTVATPPGSAFIIDTFGRDKDITCIWVGRNNVTDTLTVVSDIQAMVSFLKSQEKQFVVLSICNGLNEPYVGSAIKTTNDALRVAFPNNFCDVRSVLVAGYDPSNTQDLFDHSIDTVPSSLRKDDVHLNTAGATIVMNTVYRFMQAKAWVK